jgi:hypothetical protein
MFNLLPVLIAVSGAGVAAPALPTEEALQGQDANKIICEREEQIGSRLSGRKVCMTVRQWQEQRRLYQQDVERLQQQHTNQRSGG